MIKHALAHHLGYTWNNCIDSIVKSTVWTDLSLQYIFWLMTLNPSYNLSYFISLTFTSSVDLFFNC